MTSDFLTVTMEDEVKEILLEFAANTGLQQDQLKPISGREGRRYLWTDGFAVCTLLELRRVTGEASSPYSS